MIGGVFLDVFVLIGSFFDVLLREFEKLAHDVGDFRGFYESGHTILGVIDEGDIVTEDVDLNRGIVFFAREKSALQEPLGGFFVGRSDKIGGGNVFLMNIGFDHCFFEFVERFGVSLVVVATSDKIMGLAGRNDLISDKINTLMAVLNAAARLELNVTLQHFDRSFGGYYSQKVLVGARCPRDHCASTVMCGCMC